jgi:hypothetical protein
VNVERPAPETKALLRVNGRLCLQKERLLHQVGRRFQNTRPTVLPSRTLSLETKTFCPEKRRTSLLSRSLFPEDHNP